jgi:type I restriction enzyme S subunit
MPFKYLATQTTLPSMTQSDLENLFLTYPNKTEQQIIADFLDYKTQQIDQLIEKKKALIEKLNEQRIAVITQAVTKGINKNAKMKPSAVDWLGDVPEHWEIMKMSHIVRLKSGESITSLQISPTDKYPVYGGNGYRGYFDKFTHDGDYVLIGRQGALCGNINYGSGRFWASEHAVVVTPDRQVSTLWLGEILRVMNLGQYSVSAAQPGISVEMIARLKMPYPSYNEQKEIADYITVKVLRISQMVNLTENTISKLTEYRSAIITAAVTGKIDIRNIELPSKEAAK